MRPLNNKLWFLAVLSFFFILSRGAFAHPPGETPTTQDYSPTGGTPGSSADRGENLSSGPGTVETPHLNELNDKLADLKDLLYENMTLIHNERAELDKIGEGKDIAYYREALDFYTKELEKPTVTLEELIRLTTPDHPETITEETRKTFTEFHKKRAEAMIEKLKPLSDKLEADVKMSAALMESLVQLKNEITLYKVSDEYIEAKYAPKKPSAIASVDDLMKADQEMQTKSESQNRVNQLMEALKAQGVASITAPSTAGYIARPDDDPAAVLNRTTSHGHTSETASTAAQVAAAAMSGIAERARASSAYDPD